MATEIDVLSALNGFYEHAFSQLVQYTVGIVALVGIILPVIATMNQWRSLKNEKEALENKIQDEIKKAKLTIRDDLTAEIKTQISSAEESLISRMEEKFKELEKKLDCAKASSFHLQGNSHGDAGLYALALIDYCIATECYFRGDNEINGQRTLTQIIDGCLPNMNKKDFEIDEIDISLNQLKKFLETCNINDRYTDRLTSIKNNTKHAKVREPIIPA